MTQLTPGVVLGAAVLTVLLVEIAVRLPFGASLQRLHRTLARTHRTMRRRGVSDHWKETAMLAYSGRTLRAALALAGCIAALGAAAAAGVAVLGQVIPGFVSAMLDAAGTLLFCLLAVVYLGLRRGVRHV